MPTKFQQPRYWKTLKRHPLSAKYEDITGEVKKDLVLNMEQHGYDNSKPITLLDGMILDGWQRQQAAICVEIKPMYRQLPKSRDAEEFVDQENDFRRHETPEVVKRRADERRERVAEALRNGESQRQIAEDEGVSQKTINDDKAALIEAGVDVEPPDGKSTGKDGIDRPAAKAKTVCSKCHRLNKGKSMPGCTPCATLREEAKAGREPGDDTEEIKKDREAAKQNKNGRVAFNRADFKKWFLTHKRWLDDMARSLGELDDKGKHIKESKEHKNLQKIMETFSMKLFEWESKSKGK